MPKETGEKLIVQNKKARHDYAIEDKYEAGLALTGTEVKSLREGRASLSEAFISIDRRGEICLRRLFQRTLDPLHIKVEHLFQHFIFSHGVVCDLHALHRSQAVADQLLERPL